MAAPVTPFRRSTCLSSRTFSGPAQEDLRRSRPPRNPTLSSADDPGPLFMVDPGPGAGPSDRPGSVGQVRPGLNVPHRKLCRHPLSSPGAI
ncbi:MAG: hypothetical protein M0C28_40540 [Candidatus Moduliflexus flocculans]|nr:hypothetical protein [Candidatus Moduliflexus flocculans]